MCSFDKSKEFEPASRRSSGSSEIDDPRKIPRLLFLPYLVWINEGILYHRLPRLIPYFIKSFIVTIARFIERFSPVRNDSMLSVEPVFILGYWRSGTTYVHKLMASDRRFCFTRLYDVFFPIAPRWMEVWLKPLVQKLIDLRQANHPHFYEHILNLDEPSEEDAYLGSFASPFSAYWGYFFPRKMVDYFFLCEPPENTRGKEMWKNEYGRILKRAALRSGKSFFLSKSPPNTCRIPTLLEMYPRAKFIFIQRNPYHIYASMYRMLEEVTEKLYALQKITVEERQRIVFVSFRYFMERYDEEKKVIPEGHIIEVRYETLMQKPLEQIRRIYNELNLPALQSEENNLLKQIEEEGTYKPARHIIDRETLDQVNHHWSDLIERWEYEKM